MANKILLTILIFYFMAPTNLGKLLFGRMSYEHIHRICSARKDPGPCKRPIQQYYYDVYSGKCKQFTYGGCRGNKNRYNSITDCYDMCKGMSPYLTFA